MWLNASSRQWNNFFRKNVLAPNLTRNKKVANTFFWKKLIPVAAYAVFSCFLSTSAFADGTIMGTVTFEGQAPRPKRQPMEADSVCYAFYNGKPVYSQHFVFGADNTLGNVFVYVKNGLPQAHYPFPSKEVVIDQRGCNYAPHVLGVMVGQRVKFLNPDGTLHNVHIICKVNPELNIAMPDFRKEMEVTFNKPEFMFPIRCDVHPWMEAWVAVMDNPFFVVTKADGKFDLKLPAGTYEIGAWHEKLGEKRATVTLKEGVAQKLDFIFKSPQ